MASFNFSTKQMAAKIVYYGPGLCGKTTSLKYIFEHTSNEARGKMVSLATETDRTLFFDLLPLEVGRIAGFQTRIQLYTVPGQVFYNSTRRLVLKGVDGVVFVADSQTAMLPANLESFRNLEVNLAELGISLEEVPLVLQYNKRDLKDICSLEELQQALNRGNWREFETSALTGQGLFETLKEISKLTLLSLKQQLDSGHLGATPMRPAARAAAPAAPTVAPAMPLVAPLAAAPPSPMPLPVEVPPSLMTLPAAVPASLMPRAQATAEPPAIETTAAGPPPWRPAAGAAPLRHPARFEPEETFGVPEAPPAEALAESNGHKPLDRELELLLDAAALAEARTVAIDLQVRDASDRVLHQIRDVEWDLAEEPTSDAVRLQLHIALRPKR